MGRDEIWEPSAEWRPLTSNERELLELLTAQDFPGAAILRGQVDHAQAQAGCGCGCGTINLDVNKSMTSKADLTKQPIRGEADLVDISGQSIGGLIVFARGGYLSCLEVYTWGDPAPLPAAAEIRPFVRAE